MDLLYFRLPEQQRPGKDSFDTRPVAVQRWVEELPMGHIGGAAKHLYEMLHEVNRLKISLTSRHELMLETREVLHTVLDELERRYTGLPFPLPKKSLRVAHASIRLLQEVVIAYQAILDGEEHASWLFRKTHRQLWSEVVHSIIYYLRRILRTYQLLHRAQPQGIWQAMHALYWAARDNGHERDKVKAITGGRHTTIEAEYLSSLLLSMVEPHLFSREQMEQVLDNMPVWIAQCDLMPILPEDNDLSGYCIRRDADSPFTIFAEDCDASEIPTLLFDMSGLVLRIASLREELDEDGNAKPKGGVTISGETLVILKDCWRVHDSMRETRKNSSGVQKVEVAISMSGIFRLMQGSLDKTARGISDQLMSDELEELSLQDESEEQPVHNQGTVIGARTDDDIWSSVFYATEFMQKTWSRDAEEQEYRFYPAVKRNQTKSGFCLVFDRELVEPFQVGELMGVKAGKDKGLQLCMVRWLTDGSKRLMAGLMCLTESIEPVLVIVHHDKQRTALYCLLGIGMDQRPHLFLPHLPHIREKELFLVVDGTEVPVTLHDRVVVSPLFDAFHFQAVSIEADDEMSLQQMNRELHRLIHPELEEEDEEHEPGDFSDLWTSL